MNYLYQGPILFLAVTGVAAESTRGGELAELVANHVFGNVDRDKLVAVVDSECVSYKLGAIMEARLQVLITDFLPDSSIAATFFSSLTLINGPFFNERLIEMLLV